MEFNVGRKSQLAGSFSLWLAAAVFFGIGVMIFVTGKDEGRFIGILVAAIIGGRRLPQRDGSVPLPGPVPENALRPGRTP